MSYIPYPSNHYILKAMFLNITVYHLWFLLISVKAYSLIFHSNTLPDFSYKTMLGEYNFQHIYLKIGNIMGVFIYVLLMLNVLLKVFI